LLLIHRCVYVGGAILDIYAEDGKSQFNQWLDDGQGDPFWRVVTGVEAPTFTRYRIDSIAAE
jgi:hypothetical protein